jgi:4-hydroxy-tetrahydrodipicolinate synthase
VIPSECVELFEATRRGNWEEARQVYRRIYDLLTLVETSGQFIQYVKAGLAERGVPVGPPRRPLRLPDEDQRAGLRQEMARARRAVAPA